MSLSKIFKNLGLKDSEKSDTKCNDVEFSSTIINLIMTNQNPNPIQTINNTYVFDRKTFKKMVKQPCYSNKLLFGEVRLINGQIFIYMQNLLNAYASSTNSVLKNPIVIRVATVMYGNALVSLLNDAAWDNTYSSINSTTPNNIRTYLTSIGETYPINPPTGNPFKVTINKLMSQGAIFVACNNFLAALANMLTNPTSTPSYSNSIYNQTQSQINYLFLLKNLLPGIILVPAGVGAINEFQKAEWNYIQSSDANK
jgi:intracellular sulfur oxidation DsrE/DsrF family protein